MEARAQARGYMPVMRCLRGRMVSPAKATRAQRFAEAASALAREASILTLSNLGEGHEAAVALRAAQQTRDAAAALERLAARGGTMDEAMEAATWAMTSAAVALTQAKLQRDGGPAPRPPMPLDAGG